MSILRVRRYPIALQVRSESSAGLGTGTMALPVDQRVEASSQESARVVDKGQDIQPVGSSSTEYVRREAGSHGGWDVDRREHGVHERPYHDIQGATV